MSKIEIARIKVAPPPPQAPAISARLSPSVIAQLLFVAAVVVMTLLNYRSDWFQTLAITFVAIILEALPFVLIGSLVGGAVEVFVSREWVVKILPRRRWIALLVAAGMGLIFPICECGVVPIVRRFIRKGVPLGASIAYLLGGPIVNPLVGASTAVAYSGDFKIVALRLGIGYLIAFLTGLIADRVLRNHQVVIDEPEESDQCGCEDGSCHDDHATGSAMSDRLFGVVRVAAGDFFDIGRFLMIGAFLASVFQTLVSRQAISHELLGSEPVAVIMMMGLAVALNLCSEADAFVAASFGATGVTMVAQMGFMVLGPMLDIKLLLMLSTLFKRRALITISVSVVLLTFITMMILGGVVR